MHRGRAGIWFAGAGLAASAAGCHSPPRGFDSPVPSARIEAIVAAAQERDHSAVPQLIECLSSDDPAVRLASIRALERITGQTLGYEHAAPEWRRREMVDVWLAWLAQESGRGGAHPPARAERSGTN